MVRAFDTMDKVDQLSMATNFFSVTVLTRFFTRHPKIWILLGAEVFGQPVEWVRANTTMAEILSTVVPLIIPPKAADESDKARRSTWTFARVVEFLMQEYKWTLEQVIGHSQAQINAIMEACTARYEEQSAARDGKKPRHSQYVRHPRNQDTQAESAGLGEDGGVSSLREFAARNNMTIKKS
jgi:hypothetical protein